MIWLGNFLSKCNEKTELCLHMYGDEIACTAGGAVKYMKTDVLKNTQVGVIEVNADWGGLEIWVVEHE